MKSKHLIFIIVCLALVAIGVEFHNHIALVSNKDVNKELEEMYQSDYPNILSYASINIGDKKLLYLNKYKPKEYNLDFIKGNTKEEKLNEIVQHVGKIPYSEFQNNPNKSYDGLNCQGYALMIRDMCKQIDVPCKIRHTSNHMYDIVELNGQEYKLDIINGKMEKIKALGGNK